MLNPQLLQKLNKPSPRYTSYPTAPEWGALTPETYAEQLKAVGDLPLSLYFHIPFCKTMCLYCGCAVVLNRKPENEEQYVDYLFKEIELVSSYFNQRPTAPQLHFGGGTPTKLSMPLFARLFDKIQSHFTLDFSKEIAIEIDPRTVTEDNGEKLRFLRKLGFNRVSFGVQDTDPKVQEAVKRHQSYEMTKWTYELARELGFKGINIDLIYGLPYQTVDTFRDTTAKIIDMRPNRIALFSYAKVPWMKPHQKAIKEETLPSTDEKFQIYSEAREAFIQAGYVAIGMDHFALEEDELTRCYHEKRLQRNFQGYTAGLTEHMLSFGATSIGFMNNTYVQNIKELPAYYAALDARELPIHRGKVLTKEDKLRKWVIHTLMCNFELDKRQFEQKYGRPFDVYFADCSHTLAQHEADGLILQTPDKIVATPIGELFIRVVAMSFDAYIAHEPSKPKFSQSV